ncbi:MAG TPA: SRPBCC domain-containing protein [Rhizomicrobium sp.]|jgi:glutathione S-transferase|nr:SRPBCC domain-containing protein [Rhizomicrobium sp.]
MPHALEMTRTFNVPPARVFSCFTNRDEWSAWAGPYAIRGEVTLLEPRVGGRYRIVMHRPDGSELVAGGEFQVLDEPSRLAFTWKWEHGQDTTLVTIFLRDLDGKTEMHFRHEGFTSEEDRDNHTQGWTGCLEKLDAFLTTGERQKGVILEGVA